MSTIFGHRGAIHSTLSRSAGFLWAIIPGWCLEGRPRGLAHLGAWGIHRDAGLRLKGIVGTSIGALVGGCVAAERRLSELGGVALSVAGDEITHIPKRLLFGLKELGTGQMEWLETGVRIDVPLPKASYASAALLVFISALCAIRWIVRRRGSEGCAPNAAVGGAG
jgi:hypothetical protein